MHKVGSRHGQASTSARSAASLTRTSSEVASVAATKRFQSHKYVEVEATAKAGPSLTSAAASSAGTSSTAGLAASSKSTTAIGAGAATGTTASSSVETAAGGGAGAASACVDSSDAGQEDEDAGDKYLAEQLNKYVSFDDWAKRKKYLITDKSDQRRLSYTSLLGKKFAVPYYEEPFARQLMGRDAVSGVSNGTCEILTPELFDNFDDYDMSVQTPLADHKQWAIDKGRRFQDAARDFYPGSEKDAKNPTVDMSMLLLAPEEHKVLAEFSNKERRYMYKYGLHPKWLELKDDVIKSLYITERAKDREIEEDDPPSYPDTPVEDRFDTSVKRPAAGGLRLPFSPKIQTCPECGKGNKKTVAACTMCDGKSGRIPVGRPYLPLCVLQHNGEVDEQRTALVLNNPTYVMHWGCVRISDPSAKLSPGFKLPTPAPPVPRDAAKYMLDLFRLNVPLALDEATLSVLQTLPDWESKSMEATWKNMNEVAASVNAAALAREEEAKKASGGRKPQSGGRKSHDEEFLAESLKQEGVREKLKSWPARVPIAPDNPLLAMMQEEIRASRPEYSKIIIEKMFRTTQKRYVMLMRGPGNLFCQNKGMHHTSRPIAFEINGACEWYQVCTSTKMRQSGCSCADYASERRVLPQTIIDCMTYKTGQHFVGDGSFKDRLECNQYMQRFMDSFEKQRLLERAELKDSIVSAAAGNGQESGRRSFVPSRSGSGLGSGSSSSSLASMSTATAIALTADPRTLTESYEIQDEQDRVALQDLSEIVFTADRELQILGREDNSIVPKEDKVGPKKLKAMLRAAQQKEAAEAAARLVKDSSTKTKKGSKKPSISSSYDSNDDEDGDVDMTKTIKGSKKTTAAVSARVDPTGNKAKTKSLTSDKKGKQHRRTLNQLEASSSSSSSSDDSEDSNDSFVSRKSKVPVVASKGTRSRKSGEPATKRRKMEASPSKTPSTKAKAKRSTPKKKAGKSTTTFDYTTLEAGDTQEYFPLTAVMDTSNSADGNVVDAVSD